MHRSAGGARPVLLTVVLALTIPATQGVMGEEQPPPAPLFHTLFYATSSAPDPRAAAYPETLRTRIEEYAARYTRCRAPAAGEGAGPGEWLEAKRVAIERGIVALVDAPGIEDLAASCAAGAALRYEWEGMSEGPLGEALFAETRLAADPDGPLEPYLLLFLAHRLGCAVEALRAEADSAGAAAAAARRDRAFDEASAHPDPLVRYLAEEMRRREFLYLPPPACAAEEGRAVAHLEGELHEGESFVRPFGPGFAFELRPMPEGWQIVVRESGRNEDLSRLTPPFHFVPNPRFIEGRHFRNADNTGPNDGTINAPGVLRDFIFSPDVGSSIGGPSASAAPTLAEVERVRAFGRGRLEILDHSLEGLGPGLQPRLARMRFRACLSWPTAYAPERGGG